MCLTIAVPKITEQRLGYDIFALTSKIKSLVKLRKLKFMRIKIEKNAVWVIVMVKLEVKYYFRKLLKLH